MKAAQVSKLITMIDGVKIMGGDQCQYDVLQLVWHRMHYLAVLSVDDVVNFLSCLLVLPHKAKCTTYRFDDGNANRAYLPSSNLLGICFSSTMPEFPIRKAEWVLIRE